MVSVIQSAFSLLFCIALSIQAANVQWTSLGGAPGTNGKVKAMLQVGDSIIVAGNFTTAGGKSVNNIAIWDGAEWHPMGDGFVGGCGNLVRTSTGKIYTIGFGKPVNNNPFGYLETWTGTKWNAEDVEYNFEFIWDMVVDSQDKIWVSGYYYKTGSGIKKYGVLIYDGQTWTEIPNLYAFAIAAGNSGEMYVGGNFSSINGTAVRNIAKYEQGTWSAIGTGINGSVKDLMVGNSGRLYALGTFDTAGTTQVNSMAMWDSDSWEDVLLPMGGEKFLYKDAEGRIYVTTIRSVGEFIEPGPQLYDRGTCTYVATKGNTGTSDVIEFHSATKDKNGNLILGGEFRYYFHYFEDVGNRIFYSSNITMWDGTKGASLGAGMDAPILDLSPGISGDLVATGDMLVAQGKIVDKIGVWNGSTLTGFAKSFYARGTNFSYHPYTTTVWNGKIVAGGMFNLVNSQDVSIGKNIAAWDNQAWTALSTLNSNVHKVITSPQGELIAGTGDGAWKWSGTAWTRMGLVDELGGTIYDMAFDGSGNLWVAGSVWMNSGKASLGLAKWNGSKWVAQGVGVEGTIYSIAIDAKGNVYAGGDFRYAYTGSVPDSKQILWLNNLGIWNGSSWKPIGKGANGTMNEVLLDSQGNLLVGGNFSTVSNVDGGTVQSGNLAMWNGTSWNSFGPGTNGPITAMGFDKNGKLLISGNFSLAGDVLSSFWALLDYKLYLSSTRKPSATSHWSRPSTTHRYTLKGERIE